MRSILAGLFAAVACCVALAAEVAAQEFQLPIECGEGASCFIQHYPDLDPTAAARDLACGRLTNDAHDGLNIRVPALRMRAGVDVLAPASGVVRNVRDGEDDGALVQRGPRSVEGRECGNGVIEKWCGRAR